ncbi:MAG: YdcF family protein [Lachnospiraceae bacterium]|nr:YdcF family protein [Lachnospiraceae bacterium]
MNIFFLIIGILGDIWCILPIFTYRIFNIGNGTGILVFTIFIILGLVWKKFKVWLCKLRKSKIGRLLVRIGSFIIMLTALLVLVESICIIKGANKKPDGTETIVVLGSKVNFYGPSLMTANRLKAAIKFMNDHPDTKCVLSGGQGPDEPFSEAKGMFDYMVSHGIDENRLYLEDRSTNTRENLKFSKELIEKEGLNENIAIVSNEFHLYRAGLIAKKLGIAHSSIAGHSLLVLFPTYYIRELYAILAQWTIYR